MKDSNEIPDVFMVGKSSTNVKEPKTCYTFHKKSGDEIIVIDGNLKNVKYYEKTTLIEINEAYTGEHTITVKDVEPEEHNQFIKSVQESIYANAFVEKL